MEEEKVRRPEELQLGPTAMEEVVDKIFIAHQNIEGNMQLIEDEQLELMNLAASSKGATKSIQLCGTLPLTVPDDVMDIRTTQTRHGVHRRLLEEQQGQQRETSTNIKLHEWRTERDFDIVYDDQGFIQILQSPFFDVDPEVDHTIDEYIARILETVVLVVEDQLGAVEWRLAADPNTSTCCDMATSSSLKG
ncbi:hypothetical protein M5K25_017710 [Dendrobium thyrsiflorum]|uniref:Uncharacterized protein n=1 Tax=Dendrobium thyrsiflorum TaxID=117978 RepID=A0ABD0UNP9_DENTH